MSAPFQFTPQATKDLDTIWWFIAEDSRDPLQVVAVLHGKRDLKDVLEGRS
jgi:plasmid stabilization system protein ParE